MKHITLKQIKAHQPCADEFRAACRLFGKRKRIAVTVEAAVAVAGQFDFAWLAQRLLTPAALAEYQRVEALAWAEYQRVEAAALAEYQRAMAAAWAEYQRTMAAAWAEYQRAKAPARADYERVKAAAWAEYERVE